MVEWVDGWLGGSMDMLDVCACLMGEWMVEWVDGGCGVEWVDE